MECIATARKDLRTRPNNRGRRMEERRFELRGLLGTLRLNPSKATSEEWAVDAAGFRGKDDFHSFRG